MYWSALSLDSYAGVAGLAEGGLDAPQASLSETPQDIMVLFLFFSGVAGSASQGYQVKSL